MDHRKALIAMSGGVDSSVAALLMKEQGYDCVGCTMKLYQNEDAGIPKEHTCCSLDDVEDAKRIARYLKIPYYIFNFSHDFRAKIIDRFVWSYENGRTPNPCIDCNRYMKFGKLFERAQILGCDKIVTGHYARIEKQGEQYILKKAADDKKDQSYVLYAMTQQQLRQTMFPLGELQKTTVRKLAEEHGFTNASKPDSQDICFVPHGNYARVIELYSKHPVCPGNFVDSSGAVLGQHRGIIHYTIGQRKGLGISFSEPRYVCAIDSANNTVTLGVSSEVYQRHLTADDFNWISGTAPSGSIRCKAKIRYQQAEQPATATVLPDKTVEVVFDAPQRAVTPGQAVVLYDGDIVLGGGVIRQHRNI